MDDAITFAEYGEFLYETVFIVAPKYAFKAPTKDELRDFIAAGHNVVFVTSPVYTDKVAAFLKAFHLTPTEKGLLLTHEREMVNDTTLVRTPAVDVPLFPKAPVVYRGIALDTHGIRAFVPIVQAPAGARLAHEGSAQRLLATHALVVGFEGLTNGRLVVSGSADMFNDTLLPHNRAVVEALVAWATHEAGRLEMENVRVEKVAGAVDVEQEGMMFVNDTLRVTFDLWTSERGARVPYDADDVLVELRLVDPVTRAPAARTDGAVILW